MISLEEGKTDDVETKDDVIVVSQSQIPLMDCYQLYNQQQRTFCSITIDTQSVDDYHKSHIKNALNIPVDSATKDIIPRITEYQATSSKSLINAVYVYTGNVENSHVSDHTSRIKDTLIKHNICQKDQLFLLQCNYNVFLSKFPFLCETTLNKTDNEEMKVCAVQNKKPNKFEKMRRFIKENKGIYPNQIINDRLYLGDKNGVVSETVLRDLKITHIVNCTPAPPDDVETFTVRGGYIKNIFANDKNMGIKYVRVPIDDSYLQDIKAHFQESHKFIHSALQQNDTNRVYVHCFAGISRSATIVIAYLMKTRAMSYEKAYSFTKERREVIEPNRGFVEQLKKYEQELKCH